jgi:hypothetical protein
MPMFDATTVRAALRFDPYRPSSTQWEPCEERATDGAATRGGRACGGMFLVVHVNRCPGQFPVRRCKRQRLRDRRRVRDRLGDGTGPGTASSGTPARTSADLKISLGGGAGAGMSQNHIGLQFTNVGPPSRTLYGYSGASWVAGADGHQVGAAATRQAGDSGGPRNRDTGARRTGLRPVRHRGRGGDHPSQCKPVPLRGLRVYPPGETAAPSSPWPTGSWPPSCTRKIDRHHYPLRGHDGALMICKPLTNRSCG